MTHLGSGLSFNRIFCLFKANEAELPTALTRPLVLVYILVNKNKAVKLKSNWSG